MAFFDDFEDKWTCFYAHWKKMMIFFVNCYASDYDIVLIAERFYVSTKTYYVFPCTCNFLWNNSTAWQKTIIHKNIVVCCCCFIDVVISLYFTKKLHQSSQSVQFWKTPAFTAMTNFHDDFQSGFVYFTATTIKEQVFRINKNCRCKRCSYFSPWGKSFKRNLFF